MGAPSSCGCEERPALRFDRRGGFVSADAVPIAAPRPEIQPVLEGVLLTNARRPSATATCGCGCGGSCAAESNTHPCRCGNTGAARVRRMERPFRTEDPRLRLWQLHAEQPEVDLDARIAGLEATGRQVRGDPRLREERTWTVPTSAGLRVETTGMGDSARLDRFGRSASEREPEGLQGPFANALVPPGLWAFQGQGEEEQYALCEGMEPDGALSCAREAKVSALENEVMTPAEMIQQALPANASFAQLSMDLGSTVTSLKKVGQLLAGTQRLVDRSVAEAAGGTGGIGDPWSFEQAARILRQPIRAPGLEVLFKVDDVYDMKTFFRSDLSNAYTCTYFETRHGMLLVRASGQEGARILISSYRLVEGEVKVGEGLARFLGCSPCLPTRQDADPECDEESGVGVSLENVEHLEISWFEIAGFSRGLQAIGHCRNIRLSQLDVHHNDRSGLRFQASPVLSSVRGGDRCVDVCPNVLAGDPPWFRYWPCAVLTEDRGYPDEIEITECLLHDNGFGIGSAGTQLHVVYYATGFHIHRNLFFCTPDDYHWGEELEDGVPGAVTSIVNCVTDSGTTRNMQDEGTCKANLDKAAAKAKDADHFWLKRWADAINAVEQTPGCHRPGGDGITLEQCSSGHIIEHNVFIGLQADCNHWQRPGGTVEDYGYQAPAGTWAHTPPIGPDGTCADTTTCGSNTSDGDAIDFKGLRPRTPTSKGITLVHENLFLFCEGPGILTHYGTLGLDIARNIFAGNGAGIVVSGTTTYSFYDEWTTTSSYNGQDYEFLEMGCFRIYRNLFLMNNRIDESCDRRGSGIGISIDIDSRLYFGDNDKTSDGVVINEACNYEEADLRMHLPVRFRDFWIVNNTFHGHGEQAIWISRPEFDVDAEDPYSPNDPQLPFLLQDFYLYNNIMSESFYGYDPTSADDAEDLKGETSSTFAHLLFLVVKDNTVPDPQHFDDKLEFPTLKVDHNIYFPTFECPDDGQGGTACALRWESNDQQWGLPRFFNPFLDPHQEQHWASGGDPTADPSFIGAARWDWQQDAWDASWTDDGSAALWRGDLTGGTDVSLFGAGLEAEGYQNRWVSLPEVWNPWSYVPSTDSPALDQGKLDTGVTDLGWYLRSGELRDVGQGPDLFYRFKRSTLHLTRKCINDAWFVTRAPATPDDDQGATDIGALHLPLTRFEVKDLGVCPGPTTGGVDGGSQLCPNPFLNATTLQDLSSMVSKILQNGYWPANGLPCPLPIPEPEFLLNTHVNWWR